MTNINRMFLTPLSRRILSRSFIAVLAGLLLIVVALLQNGGHTAQARSKPFERGILAPQSNSWSNNPNASTVLGQTNFTTSTSGAGNNKFQVPVCAAGDPVTGKVFVVDFNNNRVLRFTGTAAATTGGAAEAVLGQPDFATTTPGTTQTKMSGPQRIALDSSGRLWVADTNNNRVLRFDNAGTIASGANADGVLGQLDFVTGSGGLSQSAMNRPAGVYVDGAGRLFEAEQNPNNRVLRFDNAAAKSNGANADGVLGQPDFTTGTALVTQTGMVSPTALTGDSAGRLWVVDVNARRVLRFDNAAAKVDGGNADGVLGQPDFITSGSATSQTGFQLPTGLALDAAGRLYVGDENANRVMIFSNAASLANGAAANNVLGQPNFTTGTANTGGLSASSLSAPLMGFFDEATQTLFVPDAANQRVLRFAPAPIIVNWVNNQNASVVLGQGVFTTNTIGAGLNQMKTPFGVTVDAATGKVFVVDGNNDRVLRFSSATALTSGSSAEASFGGTGVTSPTSMSFPTDVTMDTSGNLWVADFSNNRVLRFGGAAALASGSPADVVLGQTLFTTSAAPSPPTISSMAKPEGLFADAGGRLWVADRNNNRVLRFDAAATLASGAPANGVLGQPGFITNAAVTNQSGMDFPIGVTVDSGGRLWVADSNNNRVLRFENAATLGNGPNADGVLGQTLFTTFAAPNPPTQSSMSFPVGVTVDSSGRLYVGENSNNRVLIYNAAAGKTNGANADNVLGQPGFITKTANNGGLSAASLSIPFHLFFDNASQNLLVADQSNNRVLRFGPAGAPTASTSQIAGQLTRADGTPVEGAVVSLSGAQSRKTITDANGNYRFDNVETSGFYTVTPSRVNFDFNPFNRSFSQVGTRTEAAFTATSTGDNANPLDTPEYFVRRQYVDILGREPDEGGFNFWSDQINQCTSSQSSVVSSQSECVSARRIDVAAAFFIAEEFQQSGLYLYSVYAGALGRRPAFAEYSADRQQLVGGANLEFERRAFAESFVQRPEFMQKYQSQTSAESFVEALLQNLQQSSGVDLSSERDRLVSDYNSGASLSESRASVLRTITDNATFKQAQYNAAFVLTEYFGYLRRDPDQGGFEFWLNVLNNGSGNDRSMVCSFISSAEYQKRFSAVVTHSDAECHP